MINSLFNPVAWGSPIGLGIFLVCLGLFLYLLSLADKNKKKWKLYDFFKATFFNLFYFFYFVKDEELEQLALIAIIAGLLLLLIIMPKYEPVDAHYLFDDDNHAFLEGTIMKNSYGESGWTFLELRSCRTFDAFFEGEITHEVGNTIHVQGAYFNDAFSIKEFK